MCIRLSEGLGAGRQAQAWGAVHRKMGARLHGLGRAWIEHEKLRRRLKLRHFDATAASVAERRQAQTTQTWE